MRKRTSVSQLEKELEDLYDEFESFKEHPFLDRLTMFALGLERIHVANCSMNHAATEREIAFSQGAISILRQLPLMHIDAYRSHSSDITERIERIKAEAGSKTESAGREDSSGGYTAL
jgi:hypothetical protein